MSNQHFKGLVLAAALMLIVMGCSAPSPSSRSVSTESPAAASAAQPISMNQPLFVNFYAPWCGSCMSMKPVVGRLSEEYQGRVTFLTVNIDEPQSRDAMNRYRFIGQPQFVVVDVKGDIIASRNGIQSYDQLKADIEAALRAGTR